MNITYIYIYKLTYIIDITIKYKTATSIIISITNIITITIDYHTITSITYCCDYYSNYKHTGRLVTSSNY